MGQWLLISIVRVCADLQTFPKRGSVTLPKQPKQDSFDFPDEAKPSPQMEPRRPVRTPKHHGTSLCVYCGHRVPNALMTRTPALADAPSWADATKQHAPGCQWVETRGGKIAPL
jgi:hypothetical protein